MSDNEKILIDINEIWVCNISEMDNEKCDTSEMDNEKCDTSEMDSSMVNASEMGDKWFMP